MKNNRFSYCNNSAVNYDYPYSAQNLMDCCNMFSNSLPSKSIPPDIIVHSYVRLMLCRRKKASDFTLEEK